MEKNHGCVVACRPDSAKVWVQFPDVPPIFFYENKILKWSVYIFRECSFEKGGRKTGAKPISGIHVTPPKSVRNLHDPPQIQYGICMTPPPDKIKTLYLRSEFNEHLYHISHNAMTSVMYFKQFFWNNNTFLIETN